MTKEGVYLGRFMEKPKNGIEVEDRPLDKRQIFKDGKWQPLDERVVAVQRLVELEEMLTPRAKREAHRSGRPVKGYDKDGNVVIEDVEAEIDRLEIEVLGRG